MLMDRGDHLSVIAHGQRRSKVTHRELLYRAAYQMGRHLIGYEVQKVLTAVDWFDHEAGDDNLRTAVVGYGEGGLVAFYAAALDQRIDVVGVSGELQRARRLIAGLNPEPIMKLVVSDNGSGPYGSEPFLSAVLRQVSQISLAPSRPIPIHLRTNFDSNRRLGRQFKEIAAFSQRLIDQSDQAREKFTARIERASGMDKFTESTASYREYFRRQVIGTFDRKLMPPNARTRLIYDEPEYRGYEVVLEVLPDVVLYGILLLPKDLKEGEHRPVVVCQHGLEGQAQSTVTGDQTSYRDFASRLAKRGFVVFAPQHLYRGGDRFRTLQRKANPLKQSLFSIMVAQHEQLLSWLGEKDFVDRDRIGFYGISYGGKSAMRIPALVDGYCLSICSSDFSDWIWRTATNRYLAHSEYEIFEFDLGNTFNYAEMAALICPRPFMVERFHHHGLFADKTYAEFARVRLLYENLDISDKTAMTYYGSYLNSKPYTDRETFDFLHKHLRWRERP
jgi:hypothetical protein